MCVSAGPRQCTSYLGFSFLFSFFNKQYFTFFFLFSPVDLLVPALLGSVDPHGGPQHRSLVRVVARYPAIAMHRREATGMYPVYVSADVLYCMLVHYTSMLYVHGGLYSIYHVPRTMYHSTCVCRCVRKRFRRSVWLFVFGGRKGSRTTPFTRQHTAAIAMHMVMRRMVVVM